MIDRRPVRGLSRCAALEFVLEDGGDGRIGGGVDLQGSFAGGLQPFRSVGLGEAKDADTGAEALFGVRPVAHDDIDQDLGIGSHRRGPASDARRCPTGITPVRTGHVFGDGGVASIAGSAHVGGHTLAFMEDLDGALGDPGPELLFGQGPNEVDHIANPTGRFGSESVAGLNRNQWPLWIGISGRFASECATGAELLFEVFSQRYERGSILVTSNLPFDEWTEIFGSERLTGALLDRLTHHVHILEMNGESYRLNQSQKRRKSPKIPA